MPIFFLDIINSFFTFLCSFAITVVALGSNLPRVPRDYQWHSSKYVRTLLSTLLHGLMNIFIVLQTY